MPKPPDGLVYVGRIRPYDESMRVYLPVGTKPEEIGVYCRDDEDDLERMDVRKRDATR